MTQLYDANKQWASRPPDERFWDIAEMRKFLGAVKDSSYESTVPANTLSSVADGEDVSLIGAKGKPARLTHYAFGQVASLVGAPASYLRTLPAEKAADLLSYGLVRRGADGGSLVILGRSNGTHSVRAITSERYDRIWDADIARILEPMGEQGWHNLPARATGPAGARTRIATAADLTPSSKVAVGDTIGPAGLYASDHDLFAFLVRDDRPVEIGDGAAPLFRGFFVSNSEVGDRRFELTTFLYNFACGNHIVWGASDVRRTSIVHLGNTADARAMHALNQNVRRFADGGTNLDVVRIAAARKLILGRTNDEVVDILFEKRVSPRAVAVEAVRASVEHPEDHVSDPLSAWAVAQGYTRIAQDSSYADDRVAVDRMATKVLERAF